MNGICFKEPLFHATIEGRKIQTRRIINPQPDNIRSINKMLGNAPSYELSEKPWTPEPAYHFLMHKDTYIKPRYKVGDILYLKEPYNIGCMDSYIYKYGHAHEKELTKLYGWKNKLFMHAKAARYFIKITGVRAERLQDISVEDCIKEGIVTGRCGQTNKWMKAYYIPGDNQPYMTAKSAYEELINNINGKSTWISNPFVWVYDYELINDKNK